MPDLIYGKESWRRCEVYGTLPRICGMCGTAVPANVLHVCSKTPDGAVVVRTEPMPVALEGGK